MGKPKDTKPAANRRDFMKKSSLLVASSAVVGGHLSIAQAAHSFGSDEIKIGLVGCGGRGTGAAVQALNTMSKDDIKPNGKVKLIAMADAFEDRLQASYRSIKGQHGEHVDVPKERQFVGFDGYKHVLESDIDLVILATPPGFRPTHFEAAIKAGKHVFAEKPVATDAVGVRRVLAATQEAKEKSLAVQIGLQRHHEDRYRETMKRVWDGAIGDLICGRAYWNGGGVWVRPRQDGQTELEYQMRNWYYFNWLCGDHIDEQHIHNLDVINWLKNAFPVEANGMGGRQVRTGKDHGEIFDHHFVEFTYADGFKMFSQCRHIRGCWNSVSEHAHGSNGSVNLSGVIYDRDGNKTWNYGRGGSNGHQEEHYDLFRDIRQGKIPNEGEYGAKSTMTAILGRMATYSGKAIKWEDAINSDLALADFDNFKSYDDEAPVKPDANGNYAIPTPGVTKVL